MKKIIYAMVLLISLPSFSQDKSEIDTAAVKILDRMSGMIGDLSSIKFKAHVAKDVKENQFGLVKEYSQNEVYMVGPDKMHVESIGNHGHRGYWYNGETLVYYSYKENNYSVIEAPSDIITMMDSIQDTFGIQFPAADIFYPDLTDDLLENFDNLVYLGEKEIDGTKCFHLMATNKDISLQLWIANDAYFLPKKYVIIDKKDEFKQYAITFTEWDLNPDLPEALFSFDPPPNARNIAIMAK